MSAQWVIRNDHQRDCLVARIRNGQYPFMVKIGPVRSPKTTQQVRYCHSMAQALAEERRVGLEKAKFDAKLAFGVWTVSTSIVTGDRSVDVKSWGEYTREEMAGFIPAFEAYLDEQGIDFVRSDWRESE